MVALAPHLVRPLPLVVPAFEGAHPDRMVGMGLNLYDVMSVTDREIGRDSPAPAGGAGAPAGAPSGNRPAERPASRPLRPRDRRRASPGAPSVTA